MKSLESSKLYYIPFIYSILANGITVLEAVTSKLHQSWGFACVWSFIAGKFGEGKFGIAHWWNRSEFPKLVQCVEACDEKMIQVTT